MKRLVVLLAAFAVPALASAERHSAFEVDAYNRILPASASGTVVFSPCSFEIDCVVFAEAQNALGRAHVAETMGVLTDFASAYGPILDACACDTNGTRFLSARAFCLPEIKSEDAAFRRMIQDAYGVEVCSFASKRGVENWFRAKMDGAMEDFEIDPAVARGSRYAFYDLVDLRMTFRDPFPTSGSRRLAFTRPDGGKTTVDFMADIRPVDVRERPNCTYLRLPLRDGSWFYAILPKDGVTFPELRAEFTSVKLDESIPAMDSIVDPDVFHGAAAVVLPRLDVCTDSDFSRAMDYFRFPTSVLARFPSVTSPPAVLRQRVRFRLDEQGLDPAPLVEKTAAEQTRATADTRRLVFNRPFLFFVYNTTTGTIPVAGQFTGE